MQTGARSTSIPLYLAQFQTLDEHHRLIFRLVGQLKADLVSGSSEGVMADHFERLLSYLAMHFAAEDGLMLATQFSGFAAHRLEHDGVLEKLRRLDEDYRAGRKAAIYEASRVMTDWIEHHVNGSDAEFDAYFHAEFLADTTEQQLQGACGRNVAQSLQGHESELAS